jgi:LEA14-like dessication related protein
MLAQHQHAQKGIHMDRSSDRPASLTAWSRCFAAALALLVLGGCSTLRPKLEPLRLMITSVGMTSPDMFNQQFLVHLHIENPNDREIAIKGIEYKLFLQGDSFSDGFSNKPVKLPPKGEEEFDMTVRTNFMSSLGRLVSRLNGSKKVEYIIEGTLLTDISMLKKIPFRETGTVDLLVQR